MELDSEERAIAAGALGDPAQAIAMRICVEAGRALGADRLIPIASAHIDGALWHGDSGTDFAEALQRAGGQVAVPTTLNIGSLDLLHPGRVRLAEPTRAMALRLMRAYEALGCRPTWTCAPYQAGHRPALGQDVAWGESNAVAFCNSVLGARTNRYGDFLDIACALIGRAPRYGLHLPEHRRATVVVDVRALSARLRAMPAFYPVLGTWYGRTLGARVGVIEGLQGLADEEGLKAFGAAAASSGAVGLFHVAGMTPEAPTAAAILPPGDAPVIAVDAGMVRAAWASLSTTRSEAVDVVAIGSPHLSYPESLALLACLAGRRVRLPFYVNTGRHVLSRLEADGHAATLVAAGITLVVDTCIVATPILRATSGVLMTNSGKFAHYAPGNIGHAVRYGSLEDCVETAVSGRLTLDAQIWQ